MDAQTQPDTQDQPADPMDQSPYADWDGFDSPESAIDALADDDTPDNTDAPDPDHPDTPDKDAEDAQDAELVALPDGTEVSLSDLKDGYFRAQDYAAQTRALAQDREAAQAVRAAYASHAQDLQSAYDTLNQFVSSLIPPEPDLTLAQKDPGEYQYQHALRNAVLGEIEQIYTASDDVSASIQGVDDEEITRIRTAEDTRLLDALPALKDPGRRTAFDAANKKTAQEFGFSEQEIANTADHRILQLVHYARIGKQAEQNRAKAQKRVTEKPTQSSTTTTRATGNRQAMKRLVTSGSFEDALSVDFD